MTRQHYRAGLVVRDKTGLVICDTNKPHGTFCRLEDELLCRDELQLMLRVFPREGVSVERNFVVRRWTLLSNWVHFHILDNAGLATDAILFHLICNKNLPICLEDKSMTLIRLKYRCVTQTLPPMTDLFC